MQKETGTTRFLLSADAWDLPVSLTDIYEIPDTQYWKEELKIQSRIAIVLPTSVTVQEGCAFLRDRVLEPRLERKDLFTPPNCDGLVAGENFNPING